ASLLNTICAFSRSRNIGELKTSSQLPAMLHDVPPGFGPGADRFTSSPGRSTGRLLRSSWLKSEKIAAFAPMPSASDTMATMVTNGVLNRVRNANLRLSIMVEPVDVFEPARVYPAGAVNGADPIFPVGGRL